MALTERYVDSIGGLDTNGGTSPADAWQTLQKAADTVAAGTRVNVKEGTYAPFTLKTAGTIGGLMVYQGYRATAGEAMAFGDRPAVVSGGTVGIATTIAAAAQYHVFKNVKITGASSKGTELAGKTHITFQNVEATLCGGGGGLEVGDTCRVIGCDLWNNSGPGFLAQSTGLQNIFYSRIYGNSGPQVIMGGGALQGCQVYNGDAGYSGLVTLFSSSVGIIVANCTFAPSSLSAQGRILWDNSGAGRNFIVLANNIVHTASIVFGANASVTPIFSFHNCWHNAAEVFEALAVPIVNGDITDDPLFVDKANWDLRLKFESPCRNSGYPFGLDRGGLERVELAALGEQGESGNHYGFVSEETLAGFGGMD